MNLREAARTLFWPTREHDRRVFDFGRIGFVLGVLLGSVYLPSSRWLFFAVALLGGLLGRAAGVVLLICGYGASHATSAAPQGPNRESVLPRNHL